MSELLKEYDIKCLEGAIQRRELAMDQKDLRIKELEDEGRQACQMIRGAEAKWHEEQRKSNNLRNELSALQVNFEAVIKQTHALETQVVELEASNLASFLDISKRLEIASKRSTELFDKHDDPYFFGQSNGLDIAILVVDQAIAAMKE